MTGDDADASGSHWRWGRWQRAAVITLVLCMTALTAWVIVEALSGSASADTASEPDPQAAHDARVDRTVPAADPMPRSECPPSADACVNTKLRISWLQDDGEITYGPVPIMPGETDKWATPQGTFHVEWKSADWVSTEFDDPMPNSVFFAPGGIAFHQGPLAESSHGCVHLSKAASQHYFDNLPVGAKVVVFGGYPPEK